MVFAKDLREYFPINSNNDTSIKWGRYQESEDYAKNGLIHLYVGSHNAFIYKSSLTTLAIGVSYKRKNPIPDSRKIGSISSQYNQWYSICDYGTFKKRCGSAEYECTTKCEPGKYTFTHFYPKTTDSYHLFTKIDLTENKKREKHTTADMLRERFLRSTARQVGKTGFGTEIKKSRFST